MEITKEMAEAAKAISEEGSKIFGEALEKMDAVRKEKGYNTPHQVAQIYTGFMAATAGAMCAELGPHVTNELMAVICAVAVDSSAKFEEAVKGARGSVH